MSRPAEHEVLAALHEAMTIAHDMAGDDIIRDHFDSDAFINGTVMARIAYLTRAGVHWLAIERPVQQAAFVEDSHAVAEEFSKRRGRWMPVHRTPPEPNRCDSCHNRLHSYVEEAA